MISAYDFRTIKCHINARRARSRPASTIWKRFDDATLLVCSIRCAPEINCCSTSFNRADQRITAINIIAKDASEKLFIFVYLHEPCACRGTWPSVRTAKWYLLHSPIAWPKKHSVLFFPPTAKCCLLVYEFRFFFSCLFSFRFSAARASLMHTFGRPTFLFFACKMSTQYVYRSECIEIKRETHRRRMNFSCVWIHLCVTSMAGQCLAENGRSGVNRREQRFHSSVRKTQLAGALIAQAQTSFYIVDSRYARSNPKPTKAEAMCAFAADTWTQAAGAKKSSELTETKEREKNVNLIKMFT